MMSEGKTIGQLMEEMRAKAGAQNYHGHGYMDLQRFAEDTRHMIIFDVLTNDSPVGWKGERTRLFLSDTGYEKALDSQEKGQIKILSHAKVRQGNLHYDRSDQLRYRKLQGHWITRGHVQTKCKACGRETVFNVLEMRRLRRLQLYYSSLNG